MLKKIAIILTFSLPLCAAAQVKEDFSDGDFTQSPVWSGTTNTFLVNTSKTLQLNGKSKSDTAYLSTPSTLIKNTEWKLFVRMNFKPSGTNYVRIYMVADKNNLKGPINGYYIRMGEKGTTDGIDLYKQTGLVSTRLFHGADGLLSKSNNTVRLKVTRDSLGTWKIQADLLGNVNYSTIGEIQDNSYTNTQYFGIFCKYTSTNRVRFYFDDINVSISTVDKQPPILDSVKAIDGNNADAFFSESIDSMTAYNANNYTVDNGIGIPSTASLDTSNHTIVHLRFGNAFQSGITNTLTVNNIKDLNQNTLTVGSSAKFIYQAPIVAESGDIVINELLYDPKDGGIDFVELYNRSNKTLDLKDLRLSNVAVIAGNIDNLKVISVKNQLFMPNTYLVLSANPDAVKTQYYTASPDGFIKVPSMPAFVLGKSTVTLTNSNFQIVDQFFYNDNMHFNLLNDTKGVSLERLSADRPTNDPTNWHSAAETVGFATPAYKNSQQSEAGKEDVVNIDPEIFSPDNDGYNDVLNIRLKLNQPGNVVNITVFDSRGRLVRNLLRNELFGTEEATISWDGITESLDKAAIGIYVLYIEATEPTGTVNKYKKTCVLAGKL